MNEVWKLLFAAGNKLSTEARGAVFWVEEVNDAGIRVRVETGGRRPLLTYERLAPVLEGYEGLQTRITQGHGVVAELHRVWEAAGVPIDVQNEAQYWAIVCEFRRRYDAVRTLVGGA